MHLWTRVWTHGYTHAYTHAYTHLYTHVDAQVVDSARGLGNSPSRGMASIFMSVCYAPHKVVAYIALAYVVMA